MLHVSFLLFQYPPKYGVHVQQDNDTCWHIPYEDGRDRASYQLPNSWLCIQRNL